MIDPTRPSRRDLLTRASTGFGLVALGGTLAEAARAAGGAADLHRSARIVPRVKQVVFCFMSGGVSHIDSFDPKPRAFVDLLDSGGPDPGRLCRVSDRTGQRMARARG